MISLAKAFYRHPAFLPHRLLRKVGLKRFWTRNVAVVLMGIIALTLTALIDHSLLLSNGYGYIEHPGTYGWYLVQFTIPIAIYTTVKAAARSEKRFRIIIPASKSLNFRDQFLTPLVDFIGLSSSSSRAIFSILSVIGFSAFAWNTFQNLAPGSRAPLDFWDSIHFPVGYVVSRFYKFYLFALLLPSLVHIFAGVVWTNIKVIRRLQRRGKLRLAPFNQDGCGGFKFLMGIVLTPTVSALLLSGLASFGVIYTHRTLDASTVYGIVIQIGILLVFYVTPTFLFRSALINVKQRARKEVHERQAAYYEEILQGRLHGSNLRDAHEYLRYFSDISMKIDKISNWPHLTTMGKIFGISISPAVISIILNVGQTIKAHYPNLL